MLDSSDKLSFSEFPPVSIEEWEAAISKDLKGADYKQKLLWKTREGVNVLPFYRRDVLETLSHDYVPFRSDFSWKLLELINDSSVAKTTDHISTALENNADGLLFDGTNKELYTTEALSDILKAVKGKETTLRFGKNAFTADLPAKAKEAGFEGTVTFAFDPFAEAVVIGKLTSTEEWVAIQKVLPSNFTALSVNADVYGDAGSKITEQLAYALATGNEYLGKAEELGKTVEEVAKTIVFNFSIGSEYFPELAKIRAFRLLWAKVLEEYEAGLSEKAPATVFAKTSYWNKTVYDAHSNMLRATTEAMSAALGGADAITVQPFDEITSDNSEFSSRMARNIQHLLREESYLDRVPDPGAGSYYIEVLTEEIANASWKTFQELEEKGGIVACVKEGVVQAQIAASQAEKKKLVSTRQTTIVGVNNYPAPTKEGIKLGDKKPVEFAFEPTSFDEVDTIEISRAAIDFETLRESVEDTDKLPYVQLITFGDLRMRKARALFSLNFLGNAGFRVEDHNGFADLDEAVAFVKENKPEAVVLCSSDDEYNDWTVPFCEAVKALDKTPYIILAGNPVDKLEEFKAAGVDEFIHMRVNALETLKSINAKLEDAK